MISTCFYVILYGRSTVFLCLRLIVFLFVLYMFYDCFVVVLVAVLRLVLLPFSNCVYGCSMTALMAYVLCFGCFITVS